MNPDANLCPAAIRESFTRYLSDGVPPGSFVQACLENNLLSAFICADDDNNRDALPHIVAWLHNKMPANAWGSPATVREHLAAKRLRRQIDACQGLLERHPTAEFTGDN